MNPGKEWRFFVSDDDSARPHALPGGISSVGRRDGMHRERGDPFVGTLGREAGAGFGRRCADARADQRALPLGLLRDARGDLDERELYAVDPKDQ